MKQNIYSGIYEKGPSNMTKKFLVDDIQLSCDQKLLPFYLWETLAHDSMLVCQGILPAEKGQKILKVLLGFLKKADKSNLILDPSVGDVHENVEAWLEQHIGSDAGWFHVARSRNDQIAADQKLLTKKLVFTLVEQAFALTDCLLIKAQKHAGTIMPGFTHQRVAMPSSYGFWCQTYALQVFENLEVWKAIFEITDINPLGAGASYGVNWPINPNKTSSWLGFGKTFSNALAAIHSRGTHEIFWLALATEILIVLSRMMEDIILWTMPEFGLLSLSEGFTTGSSLMPQKINPDVAEKIRSKAGVVLGQFVQAASIIKGTPSGYNRDSSETKVAIIDGLTTASEAMRLSTALLDSLVPNQDKMLAMTVSALATKLADNLSKETGLPFRTAHKAVGKALLLADKKIEGITPQVLSQALVQVGGPEMVIPPEIFTALDLKEALNGYAYPGTPAPLFVKKSVKHLEAKVISLEKWFHKKKEAFYQSKKSLLVWVERFIQTGEI